MSTIITTRADGEYSTVIHGNIIETVFFGNDGSSEIVGRSIIRLYEHAHNHITTHENK